MADSVAEFYAQKAREEAERREAQQALTMANRRSEIARSPGSFNPWEKRAVDSYFRERKQERQFDESQKTARGQWGFTDEDGTHHAGGAEKVAEYDWMGRRDQGVTAAKETAAANIHSSDNVLKGIEEQAKNALELEREKQKYLDIINKRDNETKLRLGEQEWGTHQPDGTYRPGGRVMQAEAQGEAAAKVTAANNEAKLEQERIKAAAKERAERLRGNARIIANIRNNPIYAANPELAQKALESLPPEMSDEEVAEYMEFKAEKAKKAAGGKGGNRPTPKRNTYSQSIVDEDGIRRFVE